MAHFEMVNEHYECVILLEKINGLISTLSRLTDDYYLDYIFNRGSLVDELIKDIGITEEYIQETLTNFEKLRIAIYGDVVDWDEFARGELLAAAKKEREHNKFQEEQIRKLEYKIKQMERGEK